MPGLHPIPIPSNTAPPDANASEVEWFKWYASQEDDLGQGGEQSELIRVMVAVLTWWAAEQGWSEVFVGSDCFFAWDPRRPQKFVSPDVFLLASVPNPLPSSFQTWRAGHPRPLIAFEFVSHRWTKDYWGAPADYDALGVDELIIFDAEAARQLELPGLEAAPRTVRQSLQHYTRDHDGALRRSYVGDANVWSDVLSAWLTIVHTPMGPRLRLATDSQGLQRVPTGDEAGHAYRLRAEAESQRAEAESERADAERQRAEVEWERAEQERQRAERAETEREAMAMELARLRARLTEDGGD